MVLHRSERSGLNCGFRRCLRLNRRSTRLHRSERSGLNCGDGARDDDWISECAELHRSERSGLNCGSISENQAGRASIASPFRKERSQLRLIKDWHNDRTVGFTVPKGAVSIAVSRRSRRWRCYQDRSSPFRKERSQLRFGQDMRR